MKPTQDFIIVKRIKPPAPLLYAVREVDDGYPRRGIVIDVGPGRYENGVKVVDVPLTPGQMVRYHPSAGTLLEWPQDPEAEVRLMPSRDVLLVGE